MIIDDFDSDEEWQFYHWLLEAKSAGLVGRCKYHPPSLELFPKATVSEEVAMKTKTKTVERHLFHPLTYTMDFAVELLTEDSFGLRTQPDTDPPLLFIDVKGTFSQHGDAKQFSIIQKICWHVHGRYINKVVPQKLFAKTWAPDAIRVGKSGKELKKWKGMDRIGDYLIGRKGN